MVTLAQLLGQTAIAERIADHLHKRDRCVWLQGPSGSGKSTIVAEVVAMWRKKEGDSVIVSGDREQRDTPYYPLYSAMRGWRMAPRLRELVKSEGAAPLRDVPIIGNTLAFLVALASKTISSVPQYLNENEVTLLSEFQSHSIEETPFLVVLDNLHWLDSASLRLLSRVFESDVRESFTFAKRVRFLCVETEDQEPAPNSEAIRRFVDHTTLMERTQLPDTKLFRPILRAMGLEVELPDQIVEQLAAITRGHLKLAQEIVRLANTGDLENAILAHSNRMGEITMRLLTARLRAVDTQDGDLERLLRIAACIGQSFTSEELRCAYPRADAFISVLEIAIREDYLRGGDQLSFAHEVLQSTFAGNGGPPEYHAKLLLCLKTLRPSDYISRFRHAVLAKNPEAASQLAFLITAQELRGESAESTAMFREQVAIQAAPYSPVLFAYEIALKKMDLGDHYGAIKVLSTVSPQEGAVGAELKMLLALNYFKLHTRGAYETAETLLKAALAERDEMEVWYRVTSTLSVVQAQLGRIVEADKSRSRIISRLRMHSDAWSKNRRMILHRTASAFLPPEAAVAEIRTAVEHFAPAGAALVPKHVFQYVAALVNYSGVLFVLGEFTNSYVYASKALEIEGTLGATTRVVERYKICNNVAIAALRGHYLKAEEVVTFLTLSTKDEVLDNDRVLLLSNLGVAEALAGKLSEARERLQAVYESTVEKGLDAYYQFVLGCNYAAIKYLSGDVEQGLALWSELAGLINKLPDYDQAMLRYRHKMLRAKFHDSGVRSATDWDGALWEVRPMFGTSWEFYKFGFLLSDIAVWSES